MKFLLTLSLLLSTAFAQQARRIEVLFLGDKGHHKPIERVPQLMAALGPKGINITYTDDLSDLNPKTLGKYDALMVFANWDTLPAPAEKALRTKWFQIRLAQGGYVGEGHTLSNTQTQREREIKTT